MEEEIFCNFPCNDLPVEKISLHCKSADEKRIALLYFRWRGAPLSSEWKSMVNTYQQCSYVEVRLAEDYALGYTCRSNRRTLFEVSDLMDASNNPVLTIVDKSDLL